MTTCTIVTLALFVLNSYIRGDFSQPYPARI
jgi:hypothetical protein